FFFQAEDGIRDRNVTGVQTCALPISGARPWMRCTNNPRCTCDCEGSKSQGGTLVRGKRQSSRRYRVTAAIAVRPSKAKALRRWRSEEHTSELQSRFDLVCRLLLEKKK